MMIGFWIYRPLLTGQFGVEIAGVESCVVGSLEAICVELPTL
jgi:hypothetical protein